MYDSKSGLTFLQRNGLVRTYGSPMPAISPGDLLAHTIPVQAPLALPELRLSAESWPETPDRYAHEAWVRMDE